MFSVVILPSPFMVCVGIQPVVEKIVSSGDIHAFGLVVPQLSCKVTGNGLAEVHATDYSLLNCCRAFITDISFTDYVGL